MDRDRFADRSEAGRELGRELAKRFGGRDDLIVLALPRGGVPVGHAVAQALHAPLDVFIVRKLGVPWHPELAMGAIATGGVRVLNDEVLGFAGVSQRDIELVAATEQRELVRREKAYRGDRSPLNVANKIAILADDGLATGSTMRAAVRALRNMNPQKVVVAVPVASIEACRLLERDADEMICLRTPEPFEAVGLWYRDFTQTTDEEVHELLGEGVAS